MKTRKGKTVFIEYSTADKGQHFMTVMQIGEGKRQIIGRVYRDYDKEKKKMIYAAKDWSGHEVFPGTDDIYTLKKKFVESGKHMAELIPTDPHPMEKEDVMTYPEIIDRENEIQAIRGSKPDKEKGKGNEIGY